MVTIVGDIGLDDHGCPLVGNRGEIATDRIQMPAPQASDEGVTDGSIGTDDDDRRNPG